MPYPFPWSIFIRLMIVFLSMCGFCNINAWGQSLDSTSDMEQSLTGSDRGVFEPKLLRRITVFPIQTDQVMSEATEGAWWKIRERLTESRRFFVASKSYLIQKDVFQGRADLSPADVIILAKLLDADALVVTYLRKKSLYMRVYEGEYGRILWQNETQLQTTTTVAKQISPAAEKLMLNFIASVPYQGFVLLDDIKGSAVVREGDRYFVRIEVGENSSIEAGDHIQLVKIRSDSLRPIFMDGANGEIYGEGRVVSRNRNIVSAEILRVTDLREIKNQSLVRLPSEMKRLRDAYGLGNTSTSVNPDIRLLDPGLSSADRELKEKKPLVMVLNFVANLAIFLVLAL